VGTAYSNSVVDLSGLGTVMGDFNVRLIEIGNTQADGSGATASAGTFRVGDYFDGNDFFDVEIRGRTIEKPSVPDGGSTVILGFLALGGLGVARRFSGRRGCSERGDG
jgi:hypothetical protein